MSSSFTVWIYKNFKLWNLKQGKGKAYNATLSDESEEEETPAQDQFLAFVAPHEDEEDSYFSEHSDEDGEELKEAYKIL